MLILAGCGQADTAAVAFQPADGFSDTESDASSVDIGNPSDACRVQFADDSDGDGLIDGLEDANRDCQLSEGETDPYDPDTDGDGLSDGDEDVNRDGAWNEPAGELNPRSADTDRNGISDGDEIIASVCLASNFNLGATRGIL